MRFASTPLPPGSDTHPTSAFAGDSETFAGTLKQPPKFPSNAAPPVPSPGASLFEPARGSATTLIGEPEAKPGRSPAGLGASASSSLARPLDDPSGAKRALAIQEEAAKKRQAADDPYRWDHTRPTPDHEATAIGQKPVTDWTATEARKLMNHRSYIEASGPEFQDAADRVSKWFQHAFPKDDDPNGPIVTHRSATPMVTEEDRRSVDEAIARRKVPQTQPPERNMVYRPQWHYDEKTGNWVDLASRGENLPFDPRIPGSFVNFAQQASDARLTGGSGSDNFGKPQPEDNDAQGGYDAGASSDAQARENDKRNPRDADPDWSDDHRKTHRTLWDLVDKGRATGRPVAADLLAHYLEGSGETASVDADWVRKHPGTEEGQQRAESHFEEWLAGARSDEKQFGKVEDWLRSGEQRLEIKGMKWDGGANNRVGFLDRSDQNMALGNFHVQGIGDLTLERDGDRVRVRATVSHRARDTYNYLKSLLQN